MVADPYANAQDTIAMNAGREWGTEFGGVDVNPDDFSPLHALYATNPADPKSGLDLDLEN